jgi:AraC family transcriptional regulator of adaptative response/methylated-DNA-[protein]-cysteine methyltransferase
MQQQANYHRIASALNWLSAHQEEQPGLDDLARAMKMSPYHLQRLFQEWAGITPKQFLKTITREAAVARLLAGESVLEASINSGLSGPGRLHDLTLSMDALTPGEIRQRGKGVDLAYGFGETPFGCALVSWNPRGLNFLGFCEDRSDVDVLTEWQSDWRNARMTENSLQAQEWLNRIFALDKDKPLDVWLRGSAFQLKVWQALVSIPCGGLATYGDVASYISNPAASRAVGAAIGANPVAWIIPCHRVIRKTGEPGGYRWGETMKKAMIAYEAGRSTKAEDINASH